MGYDVTRFQGDVDEDLICPICSGVLEEPVQIGWVWSKLSWWREEVMGCVSSFLPLALSFEVSHVWRSQCGFVTVQAPHCEHAFCNACITQWFSQQQTCPVDRSVVTVAHLRPVPRIMRNMLSKLQIACDNAVFGCSAVVRLDNLMSHLSDCEHNPKRPVTCEQGCGLEMPKDELPNHNCIKHLRSVKRDIQLLKAYMRAIRSVNPNLQNLEETIEYNEILEWVNSLQPARVTRWGGMISTPDAVLQAVIKRSLVESGCPASIVNELIENAHERSWPQGLATLETRQMNRRYYENYVAKRIPGKQAVVVMACENQHMGDDMVQEPGLVMIFAHGVEEI
ncbi:hypothetical protein GH733_006242 [Mirounga leonina]|nr:hypothetical protein GH733_006242 [Mirounga leonina]